MDKINELIEKIKEIDIALDAYEYKGYTYKQYLEAIQKNERGNGNLRNAIKYNSNGSHIWNNIMEDSLIRTKKITNLLYLEEKKKYSLNSDDLYEMSLLIKRLGEVREMFKKNTDNLSIYPIQSELIRDNINYIISIFSKLIER